MKIDLGMKNIISAWLLINGTSGISTLSTEKSKENVVVFSSFFEWGKVAGRGGATCKVIEDKCQKVLMFAALF